MPPEISQVLLTAEELAAAVGHLAARLERDYAGRQPLLIGVLTGAYVFAADLARRLELPVSLDFVAVSSYGDGTQSSGELDWLKRPSIALADQDVVLVEDIVDSGETLARLQAELRRQGPRSLTCCALLDKPDRRTTAVTVEYIGLEIPDEFVVGYGLDYAQRFRNLPYVGVLRREVYC
ncbi:MAG: hypoxanthine phosphoribosyltransferase [Armatimonadetes bacterium]|nr:hypoxanthine phosphoribosyltransferase [Armatimonadota bacterium]